MNCSAATCQKSKLCGCKTLPVQTPVLFAAVSASVVASIAIDHNDDVDVEAVTDDDEADEMMNCQIAPAANMVRLAVVNVQVCPVRPVDEHRLLYSSTTCTALVQQYIAMLKIAISSFFSLSLSFDDSNSLY